MLNKNCKRGSKHWLFGIIGLGLFLSLNADAEVRKKSKILIFKAQALEGSNTHKKLLKSGLRFRRLKKSRLVLIEENDKFAAESFRSDAEFRFIEEDRYWKSTNYVRSPDTPEGDAWVPDFFENNSGTSTINDEIDQKITIGIVDSGIKLNHPYFQNKLHVNTAEASGSSGVDDDKNGFVDDIYGANTFNKSHSVDSSGSEHGTHVASLASLAIQESGMSTASEIKILPINFMAGGEFGTTSSSLMALEYALDMGAKVVNLSWGGSGVEAFSQALYESLVNLYENDVLVVAASGNESNNNDVRPFFPANYNLPNLISVASVSPEYGYSNFLLGLGLSFFSNFGHESVDLAAPGDLLMNGSSVGVLGANGRSDYGTVPYVRMLGTSMAAPIVSGVAAVVRSLNKNLSACDVKNLMVKTSSLSLSLELNGGVLDPNAAYAAALEYNEPRHHPKLPSNPIRGNPESDTVEPNKIGGCAQIADINAGGPPEGPFGGNSILLFSGLYAVWAMFRRRSYMLRNFQIYV